MFDNFLSSSMSPEITAKLQLPGVTWEAIPDEYERGFSPMARDAKGVHIVSIDQLFPDAGAAIDYVWAMTARR